MRPIAPSDAVTARALPRVPLSREPTHTLRAAPLLSEKEVEHFTHVDHRDREAYVVTEGDEIVAVGEVRAAAGHDPSRGRLRDPRRPPEPRTRRPAPRPARHAARSVGVSVFVAQTLVGNSPMLRVFDRSGTRSPPAPRTASSTSRSRSRHARSDGVADEVAAHPAASWTFRWESPLNRRVLSSTNGSHLVNLERATPEDLTSLATDIGSAPMQVGAIILLDTPAGFDVQTGVDAIAERIRGRAPSAATPHAGAVRLRTTCLGRRPRLRDRGARARSRVPRSGRRVGAARARSTMRRRTSPRDRPLWSATFVSGLTGDQTALVLVVHHVLADGIGGLAVLASLVDGPRDVGPIPFLAVRAYDVGAPSGCLP